MSSKNITNKVPPHNLEVEQAVLASAIIDSYVIDELIGILEEEDFYYPAHKYIYNALSVLHHMGKPLDLVTLITRLTDDDLLEKCGGTDYISELVTIIPNAANVISHIKIMKEKALLRRMISAGGLVTELGYNTSEPVEDLLDTAESIVYKLAGNKLKSGPDHIRLILKDNYNKLETLYYSDNRDKYLSGVTSGFPDMDTLTNGFQKSDLIIVAGRPGMGKTSFGLNIMVNAAMTGNACIFFSLEMSSNQLVNRIISCEAEIKQSSLRTGELNNEEWKRLGEFSAQLEKLDIYLDDTPQITVNQIRSKCRKLKSKGKLDMIFVDYLQIMGFSKGISVREQQISEISRSLKALAKELDVPVMAFAQVSRSVDSRSDNRRPYLSDLRESGAIEQDADIIMFLYRDAVYNKDTVYKDIAEVIVAKHRNGKTDTIPLSFNPLFTQFGKRPIDRSYMPILAQESKKTKNKSK